MQWGRLILGITFVAAGVMHFIIPAPFVAIIPEYLTHPRLLVQISGAAELAGGFGVLLPPTRRSAAWGLVVLLVAVFPANLWMAQHPQRFPSLPVWLLWGRLPLQLPLIAWCLRYTGSVERRGRKKLTPSAASPMG